jgi:pimeloyl-ACP methyl ester carboxylesterase
MRASTRVPATLACVLVSLGLPGVATACASGPPPRPVPNAANVQPSASASPGLDGCFTAANGTIATVPEPGGSLKLGIVGTGPHVIVLSNESDEVLCSWLPFAARLSALGYRVVLWDYGGNVPPEELARVVRRMRSAGATRIVLMGASEGAKTSLVAGARLEPTVQGVVSLSAESTLYPDITVVDSVRRLRCPLLLVTATQDPYGSDQSARQFLAAAPGRAKQLVTVPGTDHGTALLTGGSGATVLPAILAFLHRALR